MKNKSKISKLFSKRGSTQHSDPGRSAGSTLLFAVIISTIILTVGLAIAQLIVTELKTGGEAANSQAAYNAAEAGTEEALLKLKTGPVGSATVCLDPPLNNICYRYEPGTGNIKVTIKGRAFGVDRKLELFCD